MTGLDPGARDRIIEIATLVTAGCQSEYSGGRPTSIAVHQSDAQLALMDDWNVSNSIPAAARRSRVKASTPMGERDAELATIEFLKRGCLRVSRRFAVTASVRILRRFCFKYMLNWRPTSTIAILMSVRLGELALKPEILAVALLSRHTHRAMDDIRESWWRSWLTTASISSLSCSNTPDGNARASHPAASRH
ncbi:oligoribonuclease [Salmonella enterica subsp. enterica serovar Weltevreden]|nr:oligoribonuclease [Salmonella enterica subsp. enterica serovar Weltevreden]